MYFGDLDACCDRGHHHPDRRHSDRPLRPHDADEVKMSIETAAGIVPAAVVACITRRVTCQVRSSALAHYSRVRDGNEKRRPAVPIL